MSLPPAIATLLTGKDNQSYDIGRVLWGLGCFAFITYEGYVVLRTSVFDMLTFAGGLGTILASGASALYFKRDTEPEKQPAPSIEPPVNPAS